MTTASGPPLTPSDLPDVPDGPAPGALTLLGATVRGAIGPAQLEAISVSADLSLITVDGAELTALCPVTDQPDTYELHIAYEPDGLALESKALKLFLHSFRNAGVFCEHLAVEILDAIVAAVSPHSAEVTLRQQVRGGLSLGATATYPRPDDVDAVKAVQ